MRILIVEDDSRLLLQLDRYMQSQGFSVDLADDGEKALYQLKEYDYDLAIIDVGLPRIDGFEVIQQARASDIASVSYTPPRAHATGRNTATRLPL